MNSEYTILVVDDNSENLKIASSSLKENGYKIALALDGTTAIEIVEQIKVDLILLDVMMPNMDGFEVCELLKSNDKTKDIPVLFLTASGENIVKGFQVGGVDYIIKPFIKQELLARVQTHLQLKSAREDLELNNIKLEKALKLSDDLLNNILPENIAKEIKLFGKSEPKVVENVSMLVSDFVHFTQTTSTISPSFLFNELNSIFSVFDSIMKNHGGERIKTIGDAFFGACGLNGSLTNHASNCIDAAIEIRDFIEKRKKTAQIPWSIRIGIHTGSVICGVVGVEKYIFDVFGNDVNTVFRMETNSEAMKINISEATYRLIKEKYMLYPRPQLEVKGLGILSMFFVENAL